MLGQRQPEIYGHQTLADVEKLCRDHANAQGIGLGFRQSNYEGELVTWIQQAKSQFSGLVINAGAYTHTSIAILDALLFFSKPIIEVHLSHIHKREGFRQHSYVAQAATGMICGLGIHGYILAIDALCKIFQGKGDER